MIDVLSALLILFILLLGVVIGLACGWFYYRNKIKNAIEKTKIETSLEYTSQAGKYQYQEQQISELKSSLEKAQSEIEITRMDLRIESEKRSAADEKCNRIPELESTIRSIDATIKDQQAHILKLSAENAEFQTKVFEKESRTRELNQKLTETQEIIDEVRGENARLNARIKELETILSEERKASQEKLKLIDDAKAALSDTFKALSSEALQSNNTTFLEIAKSNLEKYQESAKVDLDTRQKAINELITPLKESLSKFDTRVQEIEVSRSKDGARVEEQIKALSTAQSQLHSETAKLVQALRAPIVRGRWGEVQLRRVVELAGMEEHCDFEEQVSVDTDDGRLRPDLIVLLPENKTIVVDSKVSLQSYLDAVSAEDEATRNSRLKAHASQVRSHIQRLGEKSYWGQFERTPEFVIMFLPGEAFFSAALHEDPELIEFGVNKGVIIATPIILIALLKGIAYGWCQEQLAKNAQEVSDIGSELYERLNKFSENYVKVGKSLTSAVKSYNDSIGTFEGRVLVSARKFKELKATSCSDIEPPEAIEKIVRHLRTMDGIEVLPDGEEGTDQVKDVKMKESSGTAESKQLKQGEDEILFQ
ncbi:DNA recombination protein RmuC [Methanocella sp. MCL-LM]|uniref:DNA recombination protein RmuC n=1 Tax=Methanocella sp. MCL-LM TaxID=3412035 RepID=UPI003C75F3F6